MARERLFSVKMVKKDGSTQRVWGDTQEEAEGNARAKEARGWTRAPLPPPPVPVKWSPPPPPEPVSEPVPAPEPEPETSTGSLSCFGGCLSLGAVLAIGTVALLLWGLSSLGSWAGQKSDDFSKEPAFLAVDPNPAATPLGQEQLVGELVLRIDEVRWLDQDGDDEADDALLVVGVVRNEGSNGPWTLNELEWRVVNAAAPRKMLGKRAEYPALVNRFPDWWSVRARDGSEYESGVIPQGESKKMEFVLESTQQSRATDGFPQYLDIRCGSTRYALDENAEETTEYAMPVGTPIAMTVLIPE